MRGRPKIEDGFIRKSILVYSTKKFKETGNGVVSLSLKFPDTLTEEQIKEEITKIRQKQKEENAKYEDIKKERIKMEAKLEIMNDLTKNGINMKVEQPPPKKEELPPFQELILDEGTGNTLFIVGSSKAGKSYALIKLYEKYYKKDKSFACILFTDSPQSPHYKYLRDNGMICSPEGGFNDNCKNLITKIKALQTKLDNPINVLLMFDDVLNIRYSDVIQKALLVYRNSNISTIISIQYPNLLNKSMRANLNNIMLFRFNSDETVEVAIKAFCGSYEPFLSLPDNQKIKKYKELTLDHHFLYINPSRSIIQRGRF